MCLCVCNVCWDVPKTRQVQTSRTFLYMLAVAVARFSSDDNAMRCERLVLWMTLFHIVDQAEAMPIGCILKLTHQWAAPGAKSDMYGCPVCACCFHYVCNMLSDWL